MVKFDLTMVLDDHRDGCCEICSEEMGADNSGCNPCIRFCYSVMAGDIEVADFEIETCTKHAHKIRKDWKQHLS